MNCSWSCRIFTRPWFERVVFFSKFCLKGIAQRAGVRKLWEEEIRIKSMCNAHLCLGYCNTAPMTGEAMDYAGRAAGSLLA